MPPYILLGLGHPIPIGFPPSFSFEMMATLIMENSMMIGVVSVVPACVVRRTVAGVSGHGYWMLDRHKNAEAKNMSM
jgi:hypothetical protein